MAPVTQAQAGASSSSRDKPGFMSAKQLQDLRASGQYSGLDAPLLHDSCYAPPRASPTSCSGRTQQQAAADAPGAGNVSVGATAPLPLPLPLPANDGATPPLPSLLVSDAAASTGPPAATASGPPAPEQPSEALTGRQIASHAEANATAAPSAAGQPATGTPTADRPQVPAAPAASQRLPSPWFRYLCSVYDNAPAPGFAADVQHVTWLRKGDIPWSAVDFHVSDISQHLVQVGAGGRQEKFATPSVAFAPPFAAAGTKWVSLLARVALYLDVGLYFGLWIII